MLLLGRNHWLLRWESLTLGCWIKCDRLLAHAPHLLLSMHIWMLSTHIWLHWWTTPHLLLILLRHLLLLGNTRWPDLFHLEGDLGCVECLLQLEIGLVDSVFDFADLWPDVLNLLHVLQSDEGH